MSKPSRRKNRQQRKLSAGHKLNRAERRALKNKREQNLLKVRQQKNETGSKIEPRTQARNCKSSAANIAEHKKEYEDVVGAQLQTWRSILPSLLRQFSKIKDPRNPKKLKHKISVLMMFGLFIFLFRVKSRRSFNAELTVPGLFETMREFFPEIDSIPHGDTIARLLEKIDINDIERIHVSMIKKLIKNKKFTKLLIERCLPVSIDGTEKAKRHGQLQEEGWLLRTVKNKDGSEYQQYILLIEANITFANGLNIPLLTEYCYLDPDELMDDQYMQDCELKAFYRLSDRLKKYFPRLRIMTLLDSLYACENVITYLNSNRWEYMIKLPERVKSLWDKLKGQRSDGNKIPGMSHYRERAQSFHWLNEVDYRGNMVNLVGCIENWNSVSTTTGDIITEASEHRWISSIPLNIKNLHALCNLAARKRAFIEDNFNTEKNRGYHFKHMYSYDWNAIQGFHYLMRLAHAINAISEFTKHLKKYIRDFGLLNTFKKIFDAIRFKFLSDAWVQEQRNITPQICFDF